MYLIFIICPSVDEHFLALVNRVTVNMMYNSLWGKDRNHIIKVSCILSPANMAILAFAGHCDRGLVLLYFFLSVKLDVSKFTSYIETEVRQRKMTYLGSCICLARLEA